MKEIILLCLIIFLIIILFYQFVNASVKTNTNSEGMQPYVLSNTTVESGPDFLEKKTYMEDSCGNFLSSDYNSVIHSLSKMFKPLVSTAVLTSDDCTAYQTFTSDPTTGKQTCTNICKDPQQYFDITNKTCKYCPIGFTNDGNNNCVPLEACQYGFKYRDDSGICLPCPKGKKYDNTINCIDICLPYETYQESDGTCKLTCPSRNQYYDTLTKTCMTCNSGYLADGHNNCVPAPTCPPGLVANQDNTCTAKCTNDWTRYDITSNTCVPRCANGQKFSNGQCIDCDPGTTSDGNNGCVAVSTPPPPSCDAGYQYDSSKKKCVTTCNPGFKNNLFNALQCDPICFGTSYYSNTDNVCLPCPDGQESDGKNGCQLIPTPPPKPLVCNDGYQINTDTATGIQTCQSICPYNRINNKLNPLVCDFICSNQNEIYNPKDKTCTPCDSNMVTDASRSTCLTMESTLGNPVSIIDLTNTNLSGQYKSASWIWNASYAASTAIPNQYIWFYNNFVYKGASTTGKVYALVNNVGALYFNGNSVGTIGSNFGSSGNGTILQVSLLYGFNKIAVAAYSTGGPGGLILALFDDTGTLVTKTDESWTQQCSQTYAGNDTYICDTTSQPLIISIVPVASSTTDITVTVRVVLSTVDSILITNVTTGDAYTFTPYAITNDIGECKCTFSDLTPNTSYTFASEAYKAVTPAPTPISTSPTPSTTNEKSKKSKDKTSVTTTPPPPPPPPPPPMTTTMTTTITTPTTPPPTPIFTPAATIAVTTAPTPSPTPLVLTTNLLQTAYTDDNTHGNVVYLDRQNVDCKGQPMQTLRLDDDWNGNQWRYDAGCIKNFPVDSLTQKNTDIHQFVDHGWGSGAGQQLTPFNVDCGFQNGLLTQFKLNRSSDLNYAQYSYTCAIPKGTLTCRNLKTEAINWGWQGNVASLNQTLQCNANEAIGQFQVHTYGGNGFDDPNAYYSYTCCSLSNT